MSRLSGDIFEYYFAHTLWLSGIQPLDSFTREKIRRLSSHLGSDRDIDVSSRKALMKAVSKFISSTLIGATAFIMMPDTSGKNADATDIRITSTCDYNISLKRNNCSIKHQRPSSLESQLKCKDNEYKPEYKAMNDKWYSQIKHHASYCEMDKNTKINMLRDFNNLYAMYINDNQCSRNNLINFLVSNEVPNKYIVKWTGKGKLTVYNCTKLVYPTTMYATVDDNYITLEFFDADDEPYLEITCRLHTAKKEITKNLSLKYDTTIKDIEKTYESEVISSGYL